MAKKINYSMTTKEALLKAIDIVLDANIPGLRKDHGEHRRKLVLAEEGEAISGSFGFEWSLAFAIGVTMYVDFEMGWDGEGKEPIHPKITFSYSGSHHSLSSAVVINELHRRVATVGATIDSLLARETIKSQTLSWSEAKLAKDKNNARLRYQEHLTRKVGYLTTIGKVDQHDIGFSYKEDSKSKKQTFICSASKSGSVACCGNTAKHAIWTGKAWGARCGVHKNSLDTTADPIVDILSDYVKDYGEKFLTSKSEEKAA